MHDTMISTTYREGTATPRRSVAEVLAPLDALAARSTGLIANHDASYELAGKTYQFPRYLLIGPRSGGDSIRVGLFAGIHGDEPEGVHALVRFIRLLEEQPEVTQGYCLF